MLRRILLLFLVFLILMFCLISCSRRALTPCRDVLKVLTEREAALPAGKTYDLKASRGESEYLPERLINSLFGDGEAPAAREGWIDASLFLSSGVEHFELAVILTSSPDNATDTARLLLRRLDMLRTAVKGEGSEHLDNAKVTVIGNYALLIMSDDPEGSLRAASDLIGH